MPQNRPRETEFPSLGTSLRCPPVMVDLLEPCWRNLSGSDGSAGQEMSYRLPTSCEECWNPWAAERKSKGSKHEFLELRRAMPLRLFAPHRLRCDRTGSSSRSEVAAFREWIWETMLNLTSWATLLRMRSSHRCNGPGLGQGSLGMRQPAILAWIQCFTWTYGSVLGCLHRELPSRRAPRCGLRERTSSDGP